MALFVLPSFLLFYSLIYFFDLLTCCSAKLVNITVDNASDRIVYSPPDPWQKDSGVPGAIEGTVSVTEVTNITIVISLTFIGSAIYVVGNDSSAVQAFWPEVDGRDVEDNPVLGNNTATSVSFIPYWGIEGLSPNSTHELNLTLIPGFTIAGKKRYLNPGKPQSFFLDAIIYTQESADDGASSASQQPTSGATATSSSSSTPSVTVGSDTAESKPVRTVSKPLIGGVVGGIAIVAILLAAAVFLFLKARRARGVQLCRKQSILSLPEHSRDIEPGSVDVVPRPFSTAETTTSSSTSLNKSQLYSSSYEKVTQEMMELRAEIVRLRGEYSPGNESGSTIPPPNYETSSATRFV